MANLYRIALGLLLSLLALSSYALIPKQGTWDPGFSLPTQSSASAACNAAVTHMNTDGQWKRSVVGLTVVGSTGTCKLNMCDTGNLSHCVEGEHLVSKVGESCPANSNPDGTGNCQCVTNYIEKEGQCVKKPIECPAGQVLDGQICVPEKCEGEKVRDPVTGLCVEPDKCPKDQVRINGKCEKRKCPASGSDAGDGWNMGGESDEYACVNQGWGTSSSLSGGDGTLYCMVRVRNNTTVSYDGITAYLGRGRYTGSECAGGTSSSGTGSGSGGTGGGTGGTGGTGTGGTGGEGGTGTGGEGSGTGSGSGGTGSGGGGSKPPPTPPKPTDPPPVKPPTEPLNPEGKCPPGTTRKGDSCYYPTPDPVNPDLDGKCPANTMKMGDKCVFPGPGGAGGKGDGDGNESGNGFGGTCKAGFSCEGDALQCAMAREQYARNCQVFENATEESKLYDSVKDVKGDQTKDLPGASEFNIASMINRSDALGGGTCMSDVRVQVMGSDITVPISGICPYLNILGNVLVAVSLIAAARIITKG